LSYKTNYFIKLNGDYPIGYKWLYKSNTM